MFYWLHWNRAAAELAGGAPPVRVEDFSLAELLAALGLDGEPNRLVKVGRSSRCARGA